MATYRLTIIGWGGEYIGGTITDPVMIKNIKKAIKEGSVSSSMDFPDETQFEDFQHANFFQAYGPNVVNAKATLERIETTDGGAEEEHEEQEIKDLEEAGICLFRTSNPDFDDLRDNDDRGLDKSSLVFYTQKTEKRIHHPSIITLPDGESFDFSCVYLGSMLMDETIDNSEILEDVLYIPKAQANQYLKDYFEMTGTELDEADQLRDHIDSIYYEQPGLRDMIREKHLCQAEDIEGKGEWENDYVKIINMNKKTLYEAGEY